MTTKKFNPTIVEEGLGALAIPVCVFLSPLLRSWYSTWGATKAEVMMPLLGDNLVSDPNMVNTRSITINAPVEAVWPWLVQMGQGRGGLYSYERLENLIGCNMDNADRIIPEFQELQVWDKIFLAPDGPPPFVVAAIDPYRGITLKGDDPPTTWAFNLEPIDEYSTRLIIRFRQKYEPTLGNRIIWRALTDPINFVMERKMLQGIKQRAEKNMSPAIA